MAWDADNEMSAFSAANEIRRTGFPERDADGCRCAALDSDLFCRRADWGDERVGNARDFLRGTGRKVRTVGDGNYFCGT